MGAATCYYLSKQGASVLGIEQFDIPHDQGSHTGQSRIIRKAYFEHPDYVPLLKRAYDNWANLEEATSTQLYFKTGLFYAGPHDNDLIKGTTLAAQLHQLPLENITATDHPKTRNFTIPTHHEKWFEPDAGFITPERAILTFAQEAIRNGATLLTRQRVIQWKKNDGAFLVETNTDTYSAKKIVVCGGAWSGKLVPDLNTKLKVTRQVVVWLNPKKWDDFTLERFPCWLVADEDLPGAFYGFPILPAGKLGGPLGLKFAYHHPGAVSDPDQVDRTTTQTDVAFILNAVKKFLPSALGSVLSIKTCLYTYSPDEHFIIDTHPLDEDLIVAAGFSGHGFKFAPVIGEILSDLALKGKTELPIEFLRLKRFASI